MSISIASPPAGARFMLISALGFALMSTCVKLAAARGIPLLEIVAARSLVSLVLSYIDVRRKNLSIWGQQRGLLFARGAVGTLALVCVYYAVMTLPLAEATLLQYLHPAFTALLAFFLLKEAIGLSTLACFALSLAGLILMVDPGVVLGMNTRPALPLFSVAIAVLGAFGSAIAYVLVRRLSSTEDPSVIIFYFPLIALPLSVALLGSDFVLPSAGTALLLLCVGLFTQIGQWGLTHAMRVEAAGKVAGYAYVQVVFAFLLGWYVFDEAPTLSTFIGGALIIVGALCNAVRR